MLRSISTFQLFAVLCCLLVVAHASESRPFKLRTVHRAGPGSKSGISLVSTEEQTVRASVQIPQIRVDEITSYASPSLAGVGYQASRVLVFQKERQDTRMRLLFEDNMRVVGNARACRWELRIDDKPCPSASIHGDIYVQNDVNPHRPRVVMGVCDGITQGSHTLKVFVGPTPGWTVGECATGWRAEVNSWTLEAEEVPAHWQAVTAPMPYSDIDVGYVPERELVFEKKQAGSRMRLWYYDNHRVLGQDTSCRWSLKVNGGDCRNGMIAGDYYIANIDNPHRMHVIMGYCDGLPAGKHKLQVYVDVSRFYKSADCATGWGGNDGKATVTLEAEEIQDGETYAVTGYGPADERDSGWPEKRSVVFNKAYGESSMRFTYYDNLRSLGHYKFCSWEFRIDGNRCPSGNIGADVLSVSGENPARPRVITGYCDGISVGSHTLAILVRNDFWPGDCLTGWQTDISSWTLEAKEIMPNPVLDFIRDQAASQVAPIMAPKAAVMQDPAVKGATDAGAAAGRQASLEQQKAQAPLREARVAAVASDKGSQAGSVAAQDAAATSASNAARKQSNLNAEVIRGNVEKEVAALRDSEGRRATEAALPVAKKAGAEAGANAGLLKTKQIEAQRDLAVKAQVEAQANKLGGLAAASEARKAAVAAGDAAGLALSSDLMAKQQEAVTARLQRDKGIADGVANQAATDAAWKAGYEAAIKTTQGVFDTDNAVGDTEIREQAIKYGVSQGASFGLESGRTAGSTEGKAKATQLAGVLTTDTQESLKKILADAVQIGRTAGSDAADDAGEQAAKPMVDRTATSMQTALSGLEDAMSDWAKKAAAELLSKIAGEKGAEAGAKAAIDPARAAGTEAGNAAGKEVGVAQAIQDAKPLIVQAALGLKAEKDQAHEKVVDIGKNLAAEVAVKVAQDVAPNEAKKAGAAAGESVALGVGRDAGTVSAKQAAASVTDVFKQLADSDVARMLETSQDEAGRIARDTAAADADKIADKVATRVASDKAKSVAQDTARNVGREAAQQEIAAQDVLLKTVASDAAAKLAPGAVDKVAKEVATQTAIEIASQAGKDAGLKEGETIASAYADTLHDELRDEIRKLHKFNEDATIKFAKTSALKTAKVEGQLAGEKAGAEAGVEIGKRIQNAVMDAERADASNLVELAKLRAMGEIMAAAKGQLAKLAADRLKKGAKTVGEIAKHSAAEVAVDAAKAGHLNQKAKETGPRLSQLEDRLFSLSQALHLPGSQPPVNVEDIVKQAEAEQAAAQGGEAAKKVSPEEAAEKYVTDRIQQLEKMLMDFEGSRYRTREKPLTPFPGAGDWSPTEGPPIIDQSAPLAPRNWPFATLTDTPKPKHVEYNRNIFSRSADGQGPGPSDERSAVEPYTEELNDKRKQHPDRGTGRIIYEGYDPNEDNSYRARLERARKSQVTTTADEVEQLPEDSDIMVPPSRQGDAFRNGGKGGKQGPSEAEQVAAGALPTRTAPVPDWVADEYANPEMRFRQQQQQQQLKQQ